MSNTALPNCTYNRAVCFKVVWDELRVSFSIDCCGRAMRGKSSRSSLHRHYQHTTTAK